MEDDTKDLLNTCSSLIRRLNDRIHKLESFASDIVHEFKNPLTSIKMSVDLLSNENLNDEDRKDLYKSINDELNHMDILLKDIRDVSKNEISENDNKENVSIVSLVENIIKREKSFYKDVSFEITSRDSIFLCNITPEKIVCILENIIDNAASFAVNSNEKKVLVFLDLFISSRNEYRICISVQDTGIGIQEKEENRIFNRFYSKRDDEEKKNHSGLGLSITKMMVESLGGFIGAKNSTTLCGAEFYLQLPIQEKDIDKEILEKIKEKKECHFKY